MASLYNLSELVFQRVDFLFFYLFFCKGGFDSKELLSKMLRTKLLALFSLRNFIPWYWKSEVMEDMSWSVKYTRQ